MTIASVSAADKVSKTKFNEIQSLVANIISTGSSNYGYGNAISSSQKSQGDKIKIDDWANLSLDLYKAAYHQGSTIAPTAIDADTKISTTIVNTYISAANTIDTNRFLIAEYSDESLLTSNRTTSWNATVTHGFYIDFGSHNNARYFFNSGGDLRFTASISGYSTSQGTDWYTTLRKIGTIVFNYNSTTSSGGIPTTGGTPTSSFGFYNLTGSYQQAYIISGSGLYSANDYKISMYYDSAGKIYVKVEFEDLHSSVWADLVDGTLTSTVTMRRATGSHIVATPPTGTNTTLLSEGSLSYPAYGTYLSQYCSGYDLYYRYANGSGGYYDTLYQANSTTCGYTAPPTYSFSSIPTSINEGSSGRFYVSTTNVADGVTLYWVVATNAGDFTTNSGNFTITSSAGYFDVTPTTDATTEGAETFTVALRTSAGGSNIVASSSVTINDTSTNPNPPYGTYLSNYCSGYNLYYRYANGTGGYYDVLHESNSVSCGYVTPGSQTFTSNGTFTVPTFNTLIVVVQGGGGAGEFDTYGVIYDGQNISSFTRGNMTDASGIVNLGSRYGGTSSFGSYISATGGQNAWVYDAGYATIEYAGGGGVGVGGDQNYTGSTGGAPGFWTGTYSEGQGGAAGGYGVYASGGAAQNPTVIASTFVSGNTGNSYGGGGSARASENKFDNNILIAAGGGGGGLARKTWTNNTGLTAGSTVAVTVGLGSPQPYFSDGATTVYGGAGAPGVVFMSWS